MVYLMIEKYKILKIQTMNMSLIWKDIHGIATESTAQKLDVAMLDWMSSLTDSLQIWIDKGLFMTDGELILARTNLGALVESWLKLFYCIFYEDYLRNPKTDKKGKVIEPEEQSFEMLKSFSVGILWDDKQDREYIWVDKVQHYRNAIHSFKWREIGTSAEFIDDISLFCDFVDNILNHLPPIEDYIEIYPAGYIPNPSFYVRTQNSTDF